jgi:CheY-like chemotaxis protein
MSPGGLQIPRSDEALGAGKPPLRVALDVLLVEDDAAIASSLGDALGEEGLRVATAANGREALAMLRNGPRPSAIILDLMMPVMDGWDFRHEQLRDPALKDIPVVVVTATGFSAETIRMQFGKVAVLPKPVPYLDLLDLLGHPAGPSSPAPVH